MRLSNGERADEPLSRFRESWRLKPKQAKDTWTPGTEPIGAAPEGAFREGVAFAAEILEKEGHHQLAGRLRARVQPAV